MSSARSFLQAAVLAGTLSIQGCCMSSIFGEGRCKAQENKERLEAIFGANKPSIILVLSKTSLDLLPGASAQTEVSVILSGGPTEANLGLAIALPQGISATFSPARIAAGQISTLTFRASSAASPTWFALSVEGTGRDNYSSVRGLSTLSLTVVKPFRLLAPPTQDVTIGTSRDIAIALERTAGFTEPVAFSVDPATLPPGTTATFTPTATNTDGATLRLDIPANATPRTWRVRALAEYGASVELVEWNLNVSAAPLPPDFTLTASPQSLTLRPGVTAQVMLGLSRSPTLSGSVSLTAAGLPTGATATFTPAAVSGASAQLEVATTTATPDGNYPIVITGTNGTLVRQVTVTLIVITPADFALTVNPATLTVNRGATAQAALTIQRTGNPGAVTVLIAGLPSGVTAVATPGVTSGTSASISVAVGATVVAGTYPLIVRGTAGPLARTTTLTLTVPPPPASNITVALLTPTVTVASGALVTIPVRLTRTGTAIGQLVELRVAGLPAGGTAWVTPTFTTSDTALLQIVGGTVGTSTVAVSAVVGSIPPTAQATVNVVAPTTPDFSLVPSQTTLSITRSGPFTPVAIDIRRVAGFSGAVVLTAVTDQPGAYAVNISPASTSGNSAIAEIYVSELVAPGPHVLVLRGTSGGIVREALITITVR